MTVPFDAQRQCLLEREAKLHKLRAMFDRSISEGGEVSADELEAALDAKARELQSGGKP
jgi:hypothetical protein